MDHRSVSEIFLFWNMPHRPTYSSDCFLDQRAASMKELFVDRITFSGNKLKKKM